MQLPLTIEDLRAVGLVILGAMGVGLVLALILFVFIVRRLRRMNIPPGAGFAETLQYTPLSVVLFIDLLDWSLDILAAPIVWVVLDRLGLRALRNVSAVEALIPFTQFIPTLTGSWLWVRLFGAHTLPGGSRKEIIDHPPPKRR